MDRDLASATGKAFSLIAVLLERAGVATIAEVADGLEALGGLDDDPTQTLILSSWSEAVRQMAAEGS